MKYHDPKIAPVRGMSFNTTFRGMSVLRAAQKSLNHLLTNRGIFRSGPSHLMSFYPTLNMLPLAASGLAA
ncbi:MAG: hypothetical protein ACO30K_06615, partial [bacterium]